MRRRLSIIVLVVISSFAAAAPAFASLSDMS